MRPIDADEALRRFDNDVETMKNRIEGKVPFQVGAAMVSAAKEIRTSLEETLNGTPTLDLAPVVHGEWVKQKNGRLICSVCGVRGLQDSDELDYYFYPSVYCPNCGAKMDGKNEPPKEDAK